MLLYFDQTTSVIQISFLHIVGPGRGEHLLYVLWSVWGIRRQQSISPSPSQSRNGCWSFITERFSSSIKSDAIWSSLAVWSTSWTENCELKDYSIGFHIPMNDLFGKLTSYNQSKGYELMTKLGVSYPTRENADKQKRSTHISRLRIKITAQTALQGNQSYLSREREKLFRNQL